MKVEEIRGGTQRHFYESLLGVPVFVKVLGIALGTAVLLGSGMLWQIHRTWHRHLVREMEKRGMELARELADQCRELARKERAEEIPLVLQRAIATFPDAVQLSLNEGAGRLVAETPLKDGAASGTRLCEVIANSRDGMYQLRISLSTVRVDEEVGWLTGRLALTTAMIALLCMLAAWKLTRIFSHPIEELATLTRTVKAGHYEAKAHVRARDEVGELAMAFNDMTQALAQKEAVRQQLLRKVISASEEERKRIARELHDQTGQALTSQIAGLSALESQTHDTAIRRRLAELRQQVEQTLTDVHDLSVALRPSVLDDVGLIPALQRHCHNFGERFDLKVNCAELGMNGQRLFAEMELTIYRMVQEALNNAVRHGQARYVKVLVQRTSRGVLTMIQDNGCGFDVRDWQARSLAGNHLGLLGIEERVTMLGGSFRVESEPGKGATIYADIPLKEEA